MPNTIPANMEKSLTLAPRHQVPYLPAIYEHKAWFIGETPSRICQSADLLHQALMAEWKALQTPALTLGVDIYNIEVEAMGCEVHFPQGANTGIPTIAADAHFLSAEDDPANLPLPNPEKDGRMPLLLEAGRKTLETLEGRAWLRGAISGPCSLAVSLMGAENFFMELLMNPERIGQILDHTAKVAATFGKAWIDNGLDVVVFDSQASPDLLSPPSFESMVLPRLQYLLKELLKAGAQHVPLVIGGNTTPIASLLATTPANNLLCDFSADWPTWRSEARKSHKAVRRNIPPADLINKSPEELEQQARQILDEAEDYPGFILGTGVVPFGTPLEKLKAPQRACL